MSLIACFKTSRFALDRVRCFISVAVLSLFTSVVHAAGMIPESTVVFVNVADGEGTMTVTNTDSKAALLYTSLENLPEDQESFLVVTPPVARVEPGEKQLVRFILQSETPITTQRLKRVNFEGIPQKDPDAPPVIGVSVRQNLAVLITPADLPIKADPWVVLKWSVAGGKLTVRNDSRYVVRLNQHINITPGKIAFTLSRTYLLPGMTERFDLPSGTRLPADAKVQIFPATTYGFAAKPFEAELIQQ